MSARILNPSIHGMLDYVAAAALIILPFVLGLGEYGALAQWLSVIGGIGLIVYSLATSYPFSALKLIPFKAHLVLDSLAGVFFILAPFIFGFEDIVRYYYWIMGAGVLLVVVLSNTAMANDA